MTRKQIFLVIAGQYKGGSTLLLRILNSFRGVRIYGENRLAPFHLMQFYRWMIKAISTGHNERHYRAGRIKPAWYNPVTRAEVRSSDRLLEAVFRRHHERVYGFKEIRLGCEFDSDCCDYGSMSDFLLLLKEVKPSLRVIFLTRRRDFSQQRHIAYITDDRKKKNHLEYNRQIANYERFHKAHPHWCRLLDYADVTDANDKMMAVLKFAGLPRDKRVVREALSIQLK